jgi:hypothetical protein
MEFLGEDIHHFFEELFQEVIRCIIDWIKHLITGVLRMVRGTGVLSISPAGSQQFWKKAENPILHVEHLAEKKICIS